MACTSTLNIDLILKDFESFYELISSTLVFKNHALLKYLDLMHILQSWSVYRWLKCVPLVGLKHILPTCLRLNLRNKILP
jgi:hypothetical protein